MAEAIADPSSVVKTCVTAELVATKLYRRSWSVPCPVGGIATGRCPVNQIMRALHSIVAGSAVEWISGVYI